MRRSSALNRLALSAATFVAAVVASYAQTALPILTRELYLQSNSVGNPLIQISAPSALGPAYSMILPPGPGNVGDVLTWSASTGALIWEAPSTGSWALLGNTINPAGTGPGEVFLGTRNEQPLILATTNTTTPQPIRFLTSNTERVRILANGNVGIGTGTPSTLLDVAGTFRATGNSSIGGTLTLTSVAQGIAGDSVLLINASNEVTRTSRSSLIASMGWALTGNAATTASQYIGTSDAQPLSIRTDGVERMRFESTGEITATRPTTLQRGLTINGVGVPRYISVENSLAEPVFIIGLDSSVTAAGEITFTALGGPATSPLPAGFNRILVATSSGRIGESSINDVVAEGVQANAWGLRGNNAVTDAGAFVGQAPDPAGNYLGTTGNVGLSFVTGSVIRAQISSIGEMSVQFDMRINGLTLGKGGGGRLSNTALGISALRDNNEGERNTAVGNQALIVNRFGNSNTSVGASSQSANFSGSNNTSFGSEALASIVASDNNVAIGAQALNAATGSNNTAVGHNGLRTITIGNGNVALGALAGTQIAGGTELLSATNSIFIGQDARASASGESNEIVIGAGAVGIGTNSVVLGNNLTESTRLRGRVGIGANPSGAAGDAQLQIKITAAARRGITVRGDTNQVGNLLDLQDSLAVSKFAVGPNGNTTVGGPLTLNSVASGLSADSVLLINASNQVTRTSRAALFAGSGWTLTGNANTSVLNYIGTSDAQPLSIRTNATERIRILSDGKVGIGAIVPKTRLQISNGDITRDNAYEDYDTNAVLIAHKTPTSDADLNDPLPTLYLVREGTDNASLAAAVEMSLSRFEDVDTNSRTRFDIALAHGTFLTGKNTVMTMLSSGRVGINTTTPTTALDINGGLRATGLATLVGGATITGTTSINATGNANTTIGSATTTGTTTIATNGTSGRLVVSGLPAVTSINTDNVMLVDPATGNVSATTRADLFAGSGWALTGNTATDSTVQFLGTTDARPLVVRTNNIEHMRILPTGQVGIGTSTPAGRLDVVTSATGQTGLRISGVAGQSANLIDVRDNLGTSMFTVNSSGNVAINNPVAGGSTTSIAFGNQGSGHGALLVKNATLGSQVFDFYFGRHAGETGAQLRFWRDQATEVMRIMGTGEVGIGVFPPVNRLDVGGTFGATGLATLSGGATITGATNINVTGNANTTIGSATTTGTTTIATNGTSGRLVVSGLPVVTSANTDNVVVIDPTTGGVSRTSRADLFAGSGWSLTGNSNTTNTGILGSTATGNFIGTTGTGGSARSLSFVTDNTVQMILGTDGALRMSRDIFTGWIDGATGVRVGSGPGNNYNNTVLGAFAFNNVSAANANAFRDNVAVGYYALRGGGAGSKAGSGRNVAVGSYAVTSITDGASNVGVGTEALQNISTGSTNVAIGNVALQMNTTGGSNVALGAGALGLLTTGSSNVAIGTNAGLNETGSNKLYISNSATNNLIYGDFASGLVSINAGATPTAPGASLQINAFNASTKGLIVRGAASATANLAEFQNSGGIVLASISAAGLISSTAGVNLSGAASPLMVDGSAGTAGTVLVSAGAGATPTWASAQSAAGIKSKGRSAVLTAQSTFVITGLTNVDANDGVSIVLESDNDDMDIPPYFIKRVASPTAGSITVRFSAPFTGYVTWVVVD